MSCPHCHRWSMDNKPCKVTSCVACGTPQCMGNGGARGTCAVCLFGHLDGWSWGLAGRPKCGYAGCNEPVVFVGVPRVKSCCLGHAKKAKSKFLGKTRTLAEIVEENVRTRRRAYERNT